MHCLTLYQRNLDTEIRTPLPYSEPFTIGRAGDVKVEMLRKIISRVHVRVIHQDLSWLVEDVGSRNGLFSSTGQKVQSISLSNPGDSVWMAIPQNEVTSVWLAVESIKACELNTDRVDLKAWQSDVTSAIDELDAVLYRKKAKFSP